MAGEIKLDLTYEEQVYTKLMNMKTKSQAIVNDLRTVAGTCQDVFQSGSTKNAALPTFQQMAEKYNQLDVVIGVTQQFILDTFQKMIDQDKLISLQVVNGMLESSEIPESQKKHIRENKDAVLAEMKEAVKKDREASERGEVPVEEPEEAEQYVQVQSKAPVASHRVTRPSPPIPKRYQAPPKQHVTTEPKKSAFNETKTASTSLSQGSAFEVKGSSQSIDTPNNETQHSTIQQSIVEEKIAEAKKSATPPNAADVHTLLKETAPTGKLSETAIHKTVQSFQSEQMLSTPTIARHAEPFQKETSIIKAPSPFQPKTISRLNEMHIIKAQEVQAIKKIGDRAGF